MTKNQNNCEINGNKCTCLDNLISNEKEFLNTAFIDEVESDLLKIEDIKMGSIGGSVCG